MAVNRPPDAEPSDPEVESPTFDEIGVHVGPDRDGAGLFDPPTTEGTDNTATHEHTDVHGSSESDAGTPRRMAVLAWIAANPAPSLEPTVSEPCEPLKRRIADEPLDMVPALEGLPAHAVAPQAPEREDTATRIEGFEAVIDRHVEAPSVVDPPRTVRRLLLVALAAAVAALVLELLRR